MYLNKVPGLQFCHLCNEDGEGDDDNNRIMGFPQVIQDDCEEKKGAQMGKRLPDNYHFKLSTAKPFQGSKSGAQAGRRRLSMLSRLAGPPFCCFPLLCLEF